MKHYAAIGWLLLLPLTLFAQLKVDFNGQLSGWGFYNFTAKQGQLGERFVPEVDLTLPLKGIHQFDVELSTNMYGSYDFAATTANLKPYRLSLRYSNSNMEWRAGLQKISFGSATLFRPLMWFDRMDKRDPLQLTDGVYGLLGRYYFGNNANIWLWGLYGNNEAKGLETYATKTKTPELGGRVQVPLFNGELAVSFHERMVMDNPLLMRPWAVPDFQEYRVGLDGKWDIGPGIWFESSVQYGDKGTIANGMGYYNWDAFFTVGMDYTFSIGSGLTALVEYFGYNNSPQLFKTGTYVHLLGAMLSYPISINDNITAMLYYSLNTNDLILYGMYGHTWDKFSLYGIVFHSPASFNLPMYSSSGNAMFSGTGVQLMGVYYF